MKVMTYNILNGGGDGPRRKAICEAIREQEPDVVGIQEALGFEAAGSKLLYEFEQRLGMRGILAEAYTGQNCALFVRRDIAIECLHIDARHFHHALVRAVLRCRDGQRLSCLVTHLCPHGGDNRIREVQFITNYARASQLVVLMGDLNSLSPRDTYPADLGGISRHYLARHLHSDGSGKLDTRAIGFLELAGFTDVLHTPQGAGFTAPSAAFREGSEFNRMRVDYIFATTPLTRRLQECSVVQNARTEIASDHYPVVASFDLDL